MFTPFGNQSAGIIQDSLYYNLDVANLIGAYTTPVPLNTTFLDLYTGRANNTQVKSGSFTMSADAGYLDFNSANTTGSILLPDQNIVGRTFLISSSWTIQWWGWWDVISGRDVCLYAQGDASSANGLHIQARNSKLQFAFYLSDLTSVANLVTGRWQNYACVYKNGSQLGYRKEIYINGALDNAANGNAYGGGSVGRPFAIGSNLWAGTIGAGSNAYDGRIGQTLIYGRALNASEIRQNYEAGKNRFNIFN